MDPKPFQPVGAGTFYVANAVAASSPASLPAETEQVVLYNSSATATAFWRCQIVPSNADAGASAVVPTTANPGVGDFPIPPGQQLRVTVGYGHKRFSTIASAADGNLYITPGRGN